MNLIIEFLSFESLSSNVAIYLAQVPLDFLLSYFWWSHALITCFCSFRVELARWRYTLRVCLVVVLQIILGNKAKFVRVRIFKSSNPAWFFAETAN